MPEVVIRNNDITAAWSLFCRGQITADQYQIWNANRGRTPLDTICFKYELSREQAENVINLITAKITEEYTE